MIRNKIANFDKGNIWKAVKIAKNQSTIDIPPNLTYKNVDVSEKESANVFAEFFHEKIENFKAKILVSNDVHNGHNKLVVASRFFMEESDIRDCLDLLKPKMCEIVPKLDIYFFT